MRKLGELSAAVEAGFACGRERRRATRDELERFRSLQLSDAYWRAYGRGMRSNQVALELVDPGRPALEQIGLELTRGDGS
jgi:hypothetical protein